MDVRREILRNVILCQALAPLGKKHAGKRWGPPQLGPKLEHLLVAGVNCGWQFYDLADRILTAGRQPDCIFDLAYEAQRESTRGRLGGKVNYGPIHMLIPLITAQLLDYLETGAFENVESFLERTGDVLRRTTPRDVEALERFVHLGYDVAAKHRARTGRPMTADRPVLKGRYQTVWDACQDFQQMYSVREMTKAYPYSQQIYRFLLHNVETGILAATEMIYQLLVPEVGRTDVVADLIVVGLYLLLTKHPEGVLFV
ncbi:MAG TPA: hypothetical protein VHG32_06895 [Thermoanaerobaculia bacterium]|jgi:hypothetical protein|nr:hypothetical protein [Thermoanaerobaculia bacterium]